MSIRATLLSFPILSAAIGLLAGSALGDDIVAPQPLPAGVVGRFGSTDFRTLGWSTASALSPDGKLLAVAGEALTLTDLSTGKIVRRFELEKEEPTLLSFIDEGKTLISVTAEGLVRHWPLEKNVAARPSWPAVVPAASLDDTVYPTVQIAPGGRFMLAVNQEAVTVWDHHRQVQVHRFKLADPKHRGPFALAPDGKTIATLNKSGIAIWDAATGTELRASKAELIDYWFQLAFSPDGKLIVLTGGHNGYGVWDAATLTEKGKIQRRDKGPRIIEFSPDSRVVAVLLGDSYITLYEAQTQKEVCKMPLRAGGGWSYVQSVSFTPDGRRLVAAEVEGPCIHIWDTTTGEESALSAQPQTPADRIVASPDGTLLATVAGRRVHVWDTATYKQRFHLPSSYYIEPRFSRDSVKLVHADDVGQTAFVVDTHSGRELARFVGHTDDITAVAFRADDTEVVTVGRDHTLRVWNAETGRQLRVFSLELPNEFGKERYNDRRYDTFSGDGTLLITRFDWQHNHALWRVPTSTGERIVEKPRPELGELRLSPDGRTYIGHGKFGTLDLIDTESGESLFTFRQPDEKVGMYYGGAARYAFSSDGRLLAMPKKDSGGIEVWDVKSRKVVQSLPPSDCMGATGFVGKNRLATSRLDTTTLLWDVSKARSPE